MGIHSTTPRSSDSDAERLRETQRLLEQAERRYRELFDLAPVGYLLTDLEGTVLEANQAATELLTRDRAELTGTQLVELIAAERRREFRKLLAEVARGTRRQDEFSFLAGLGGSTLLRVDALALPPDVTDHALLVITDVSSASRRERAEREFVTNAAHQLRTPVTAIAGAVEVLQGGAKEIPEARDRFLRHLDDQCGRLVRLTRALLLLARAQALSEPPAVELVAICPLLEGIGRGLRPADGVDVRVDCPTEVASLTNRVLLEQALENLAENAAKFTRKGEIVLSASTTPAEEVCIVVSDTGPGAKLPPADGTFERFYRDPAVESEGFGLGLAIAAEALRVVHAELVVEATGAGTRAIVTLPSASVFEP